VSTYRVVLYDGPHDGLRFPTKGYGGRLITHQATPDGGEPVPIAGGAYRFKGVHPITGDLCYAWETTPQKAQK
jgi:hypothetical protein